MDATVGQQLSRSEGAENVPEAVLWAALSLAPDEGTAVPGLMDATGMSRPWIYLRLRELAKQGQVIQVGRGHWRAVMDDAAWLYTSTTRPRVCT